MYANIFLRSVVVLLMYLGGVLLTYTCTLKPT